MTTDTAPPLDPVWQRIRAEAEAAALADPSIATFLHASVLGHARLDEAIVARIADRLASIEIPATLLGTRLLEIVDASDDIRTAIRVDLQAVVDRDPAAGRLLDPVLFFKGFQAIQTHRCAHAAWIAGRRDFALLLQSRASAVFQVDIHPAARIGRGVFVDHATGIVIGETAVVEDDVSMLQGVALGGTGVTEGERHPKVRRGVLIGAGALVLGDIEIGEGSQIGAGSLVNVSVPAHATVVGVPARVVATSRPDTPGLSMNQMIYDVGL